MEIEQRRRNLVTEAQADKAEVELLTDTFNESTGLTWLWSMMFGPMYFWVHGFIGRGFLLLAICVVTLGFGILLAPFLAYPGWKKRAQRKASNMTTISKARRGE
ncbi:hypothetical protein OS189_03820 [Sulfitobacter sp. F26169L]|uniref:hypothetical protein n=1 Tax=Sulfitobacter sp. F26169L TaxID=2996015 RepID=UPI002260A204|nr:hypothetical protein [Sulfitobacter sp. F26169L]MCX7565472.1 hypothetical protein [Sulfitobacter sp. F26169L]